MKRIIILFSFILVFFTNLYNLVFANTARIEWDCLNLDYINSIKSNIIKLLPTQQNWWEIVSKAISNLQRYCLRDNWVLQTPHFINHLLDVYFRFLDWIQTIKYSWPFYSPSKQRRNLLKIIAKKNFKNIKPYKMKKLFKKIYVWLIMPKYYKFCSKIPELTELIEIKESQNSDTIIVYDTKDVNYCNKIAKSITSKETFLFNQILYKIYYVTYLDRSFKYFKAYASKFNKLYDIFVNSLWDFYYFVTKYIKVTDANTK